MGTDFGLIQVEDDVDVLDTDEVAFAEIGQLSASRGARSDDDLSAPPLFFLLQPKNQCH